MLNIAATVIPVDDLHPIGRAVSIGIGGMFEDVLIHEENALFEGEYGSGDDQVIKKNGGAVHDAIPIPILQAGDAADGSPFLAPINIHHEASHLHDIQPSVRIKGHCDWILNHWFGSCQSEGKALLKDHRFHRCLRCSDR